MAMIFRKSRQPRLKDARIKCHVIDAKTGKIMVTPKTNVDKIIYVNPADVKDGSVAITLILNPQGIWAVFRTNEKYSPFEIRDEDLIIDYEKAAGISKKLKKRKKKCG